jgi:hypothetical protein
MRVGLSSSPTEFTATYARFPQLGCCRVFGPAGAGIPGWGQPLMRALRNVRVLAWPSFKDWSGDQTAATALTRWCDSLPDDVAEVWLTYHHEPEGDLPPDVYRARWAVTAKTVRGHRNAARVRLVPIHSLWPAVHKVGDRYNKDWTKWVGVWQQWAPTGPDGAYLGDLMGWDCYVDTAAVRYPDPGRFFAVPVGAAGQAGVPLVVPELGTPLLPGDPGGVGRGLWIRDCLTYLREVGVLAVNWWQSTGTSGTDYRLRDAPSVEAWATGISMWRATTSSP